MAAGAVLAVAAAVLLGVPALAEGRVEVSNAPQVAAGQEVDGSAWLAGNSVDVAGTVRGDLFCAGNTVTISGVVEGDVVCAGNTVTVLGRVSGDLRLAGNSVTVGGSADGSATIGGNGVTLTSGSSVGSDLSAAAATVNLGGAVGRDARLVAGAATLAGGVGRDVDADVDTLTVTQSAAVGGHVHYVSPRDAAVAPGTVQGDVRRTAPAPQTPPEPQPRTPTVGEWLVGAALRVAGLVALSVAVVLLLPGYVRRITDASWPAVGKAALVGLLTLAAGLPVVVMLFVTILGAGAGLLLLTAFPLGLLLAAPVTSYLVGRAVMRRYTTNMIAMVAVGAAIVGVAAVVPFLGLAVAFASACVGLGLIVQDLRRQFVPPTYTDRGGPVPLPAGDHRNP